MTYLKLLLMSITEDIPALPFLLDYVWSLWLMTSLMLIVLMLVKQHS